MNIHRPGHHLHAFIGFYARILLAGFALLAAPLHAAGEGPKVYAGTVGAAPVVMELEGSGEDVTGRYFYRKSRFDIHLSGSWAGETLTVESRTSGDRLTLRRAGSGLTGSLTTSGGRQASVSLSPVDDAHASANGVAANMNGSSTYDRQRLSDLALVPGAIRKEGARNVRDWREPISGITLFRIERGYPAPALEKINAALERQHWQWVSLWFACEGSAGGTGMDISEARALYLNDDFISYAWFASWFCAGTAHPDFGTQSFTFDAQTGRELQLEDLLYFGAGPVAEEGTSPYYDYRSDIFAPRVVTLFKTLYPSEIRPENGCDYDDPSVWQFPSWYLTPKGLYLEAHFSPAQRACDGPEWSVIPWQYLTWRKADTLAPNPRRSNAITP